MMKKNNSSKQKGYDVFPGINHTRYDHKRRPVRIEVKCPKCDGLAVAEDQLIDKNYKSFEVIDPHLKSSRFKVLCTECFYRNDEVTYEDLPKPYYQFNGRRKPLWAFNSEHLDMIYKYLIGESIKEHKYEFYETYINGDWLKYSASYIKEIEKKMKDP